MAAELEGNLVTWLGEWVRDISADKVQWALDLRTQFVPEGWS